MVLKAIEADRGKRLDAFLHEQLPQFSRSHIQSWIRSGRVFVGGRIERPAYQVRGSEEVDLEPALPPPLRAEPEAIPSLFSMKTRAQW